MNLFYPCSCCPFLILWIFLFISVNTCRSFIIISSEFYFFLELFGGTLKCYVNLPLKVEKTVENKASGLVGAEKGRRGGLVITCRDESESWTPVGAMFGLTAPLESIRIPSTRVVSPDTFSSRSTRLTFLVKVFWPVCTLLWNS